MAAITGIKTELLTKIDQVNARIDKTSGPTDIPGYMAWNEENLAAYEHPGFVDADQDATIEALMADNAAKEAERLSNERFYCSILHRFVSAGRMTDLHNDAYVDQWYNICSRIFKAMSWTHEGEMSADMDDTIYNTWHRAKVNLDEEGWNIATSFIFERLTGSKPNTSTPAGCTTFNNFSTAYNKFCAEHNFNPTEGFEETHNAFFRLYSKTISTTHTDETHPAVPSTKTVRFTSIPPIETLPKPPSSSPEDFPVLQPPSKAPISYASATSAFIPVTRRRRGKPTTTPSTATTNAPAKTTSAMTPTSNKPNTPKSLRPNKPPLPDTLKTTKHTIILDHSHPDTKGKYSIDAGELTRGLQCHLEVVKAPLVLLAGVWSTAPFYKNFILTFSGVVNYTDITKYNSVLFGPFGDNCHAAPTAGYQSILISSIRLQRDASGKLASPKMLFDELCQNLVFVGRLPLAAPRWLFNPEKLLASDKQASSITFAFHDPTGEGLELMKRSHVGMFGKLVTIRSWETRPLLSQCTCCLRLGHTVERCHQHKDLVVCSKCGGAHQDNLHHFNCPRSDRHKGRGCDCPPLCFLCIAQGNHKAAQGHTSTSVTCPIQKHFRLPSADPTDTPANCARSTTIPPTPAMSSPMNVLTSTDIRQLSADGMSTEAITRLLVPQEIANMATAPTPMAL